MERKGVFSATAAADLKWMANTMAARMQILHYTEGPLGGTVHYRLPLLSNSVSAVKRDVMVKYQHS